MDQTWFVYLLRCADDTLYAGVATDLERRVRPHNGELVGRSRYTRVRRPVELVWSEAVTDRAEAQRREAEIKKLSREDKLALVVGP